MTQLSSEKPELFKGRHFNYLLIIQAVRWYVTYKLSYRDVCDLMAERGVTVVPATVSESDDIVVEQLACFGFYVTGAGATPQSPLAMQA
jgi:hypothetical protein